MAFYPKRVAADGWGVPADTLSIASDGWVGASFTCSAALTLGALTSGADLSSYQRLTAALTLGTLVSGATFTSTVAGNTLTAALTLGALTAFAYIGPVVGTRGLTSTGRRGLVSTGSRGLVSSGARRGL